MGLQNGEKKGMIYYYDYSEQMKYLTDEQFRDVIYVLAEMERTGEVKENKERLERIKNNALAETIFMITIEQQKRASTAWHNINRAKHKEKYEKQKEKEKSTESPLKCPTMPQSIEEGHDTAKPVESDLRAEEDEEKEELKNYVVATGKYKKDGLSIQEIYEQDPEWIEEMAKNRNPENALAKEDIEFIRKYVEVILNKPVESDFRAKNEVIEVFGYVMSVNEEEGTLSLEEGDTYTFDPDKNPNITDFNEKYVMILHNNNEIIEIREQEEEDTPF